MSRRRRWGVVANADDDGRAVDEARGRGRRRTPAGCGRRRNDGGEERRRQ